MRTIQIAIFLCIASFSQAQSIGAYVISSSGQTFMNENGGLYFSIGEPIMTEISNEDIMISQGFLQITIAEVETSIEDLEEMIHVYPNPTANIIHIEWKDDSTKKDIELFNLNGKSLAKSTKLDNQQYIDISHLPTGTYLLQVNNNNKSIGTYKINKL